MKLIKIILIILIGLISIKSYSKDLIPGFFETDVNYSRAWSFSTKDQPPIGFTELKVKYGGDFNWLDNTWEYYGFAGWRTFFLYDEERFFRNYPWRDIYSFGIGIDVNIFYFQYEHKCSHSVVSENNAATLNVNGENYMIFDGMPTLSYDSFKVGIKVRID